MKKDYSLIIIVLITLLVIAIGCSNGVLNKTGFSFGSPYDYSPEYPECEIPEVPGDCNLCTHVWDVTGKDSKGCDKYGCIPRNSPVECKKGTKCSGLNIVEESCNPRSGKCEDKTQSSCNDGNSCTDDSCLESSKGARCQNKGACFEKCNSCTCAGEGKGTVSCPKGNCKIGTECGDDKCCRGSKLCDTGICCPKGEICCSPKSGWDGFFKFRFCNEDCKGWADGQCVGGGCVPCGQVKNSNKEAKNAFITEKLAAAPDPTKWSQSAIKVAQENNLALLSDCWIASKDGYIEITKYNNRFLTKIEGTPYIIGADEIFEYESDNWNLITDSSFGDLDPANFNQAYQSLEQRTQEILKGCVDNPTNPSPYNLLS